MKDFQTIINESERIVFFGGAGVSTESGIPDFRSDDGLYNQQYEYPPEKILSRKFFYEKTDVFYAYCREKIFLTGKKPNQAHLKLAELEQAGKLSAVITQNIDGLHAMAGSVNVYELHGSVNRFYCTHCGKLFDLGYILSYPELVPSCSECGCLVKPDVVLYGEMLDHEILQGSAEEIRKADTLIIGGTSLVVNPAAGLVNYFSGKNLVLINKSETSADRYADLVIRENIGKVFSGIKVI